MDSRETQVIQMLALRLLHEWFLDRYKGCMSVLVLDYAMIIGTSYLAREAHVLSVEHE